MAHQPYPKFSLECATELWRILRQRSLRDESVLAAKCSYTLSGAGLGLLVGEPPDVEPSFGDAGPELDLETAESLRSEMQTFLDEGERSFGDAKGEAAIDPIVMVFIVEGIKLALKAIESWIKKRREG
jgi:hypothetical protein